MAVHHKVAAAAVVVNVEGQERYLYRGAVLPEGVSKADVRRLLNNGMLSEVEVPDGTPAPTSDPTEIPEGDPTDKWTVPQLKAYAEKHGIDLKGATKRAEVAAKVIPPAAPATGAEDGAEAPAEDA